MHSNKTILTWCAIVLAVIVSVASMATLHFNPLKAATPQAPAQNAAQAQDDAKAQAQAPDDAKADNSPEEDPHATARAHEEALKEAASRHHLAPIADKPETFSDQDRQYQRPVSFTLKVDGMELDLLHAPVSVSQVLRTFKISMGKDDIVTPAKKQVVEHEDQVVVERITFDEVVVSEEIPFKTKVKGTDELPAGTKKVVQKGQKGEEKVTYKVTYSDGKEVARKEIARERVKKPVTKIIAKSTVGTIQGREYSRKFTVKAYSYTGGGTTASGLPAAEGRIAVDPSVIPLGTKVYVEGYGFAVAADTGGNINGNTIDVYFNSRSSCINWGCRYITIYILK